MATDDPPLQAVLILAESRRPLAVADLAAVESDALLQVDHAWVWSPRCAVTRVEAADLEDFRCSAAPTATLRLSWPRQTERHLPSGALHAASSTAWAEVPEPLLPRWPVGPTGIVELPVGDQQVTVRFAGGDLASDWLQGVGAGDTVDLRLLPATDGEIALRTSAGTPPDLGHLSLGRASARRDALLSLLAADADGTVHFPGFPRHLSLVLVASGRGVLPHRLVASAEALPTILSLKAGCTLTGRVESDDGQPVAGAELVGESYTGGGADLLIRHETATNDEGDFRLGPLVPGSMAVRLSAEGMAPRILELRLAECLGAHSLGAVALTPARSLLVTVVDDLRIPVVGARVEAASAGPTTTDEMGRATVRGVPTGSSVPVAVDAPGHLSVEKILLPPLPEVATVMLQRAAEVRGRLVDAEGEPVSPATVEIRHGSEFRERDVDADGSFRLELPPGRPADLHFMSPMTVEVTRKVEALQAGEIAYLGDVVTAAGRTVLGRLLRVDDAKPVVGAAVWALRRGTSGGSVVAWAFDQRVETRSGQDGSFELSGLTDGPASIRITAADLAVLEILVPAAEDEETVDLGDVFLSRGSTLRVTADVEDGALARLDIRGEWREMDMISAGFIAGEAQLVGVPPGTGVLTVLEESSLVCEQEVTVPQDDEVRVDCQARRLEVSGTVTEGGEPTGPGTLTWLSETGGDTLILNRRSPLGATESRILGAGRPQVDVAVDAVGRFATGSLAGGSWQVTWRPIGGGTSRFRDVELQSEGEVQLALDFAPHFVNGRVLDDTGEPVVDARVENLDGRSTARSMADGSFKLLDLDPGIHRIAARKGELRSASAVVEIQPRSPVPPIVLTLDRSGHTTLDVSVVVDDQSARGGFVFLDQGGPGLSILNLNGSGLATQRLTPPYPPRVRAAAIVGRRLLLGDWHDLEIALREGLTLGSSASGDLEVVLRQGAADLSVESSGWSVDALYRHLGYPLTVTPERPLHLPGLPPGVYQVGAGNVSRSVVIEVDDTVRVELDPAP